MPSEINFGEQITDITMDEEPFAPGETDENSAYSEDTPVQPDGMNHTGETTKGESRPTYTRRRKSVAELFSFAWGGAGTFLAETGTDPAVGRVMQFQAPMAGEKFDELIAGTFVDHLLQPIVGKGESMKGAGAIFALPIVIGMLERNPANPILAQVAYELVSTNLAELVPVIKRKQREQRRNVEALKEVSEVFDIPEGSDPVQFVLMNILGPPRAPVRESPEGAEAWESVPTE